MAQTESAKRWYEKNREKVCKDTRRRQLEKGDREHYEKCYEYYKNYRNSEEVKRRNARTAQRVRSEGLQILRKEGLMTDCIICGFSKDIEFAIDFHHIDPKTKKATIASLLGVLKKRDQLIEEAKKCVCMCANCHRLYHNNDEFVVEKYNEVIKKKGDDYDFKNS